MTSGGPHGRYKIKHDHAKMNQDLYEGKAKLYRGDTITVSQGSRSSGTVEQQKRANGAHNSAVSAQISFFDAEDSIRESSAALEAAHGLLLLHGTQHGTGGGPHG